MPNPDQYRSYAWAAVRQAEREADGSNRLTLLDIAQKWLDIAQEVERREAGHDLADQIQIFNDAQLRDRAGHV